MATHTSSASGVAVIGIDIGKDTFHLLGFDGAGSVVLLSSGGAGGRILTLALKFGAVAPFRRMLTLL
jgi:hydrogenase maturation factor HypE